MGLAEHCTKVRIGSGISCTAYDVGDGIVYKKFEDIETAQQNFRLQLLFSEHGLAPDVIAIDGEGYYSEKVKVCQDYDRAIGKFARLAEKMGGKELRKYSTLILVTTMKETLGLRVFMWL